MIYCTCRTKIQNSTADVEEIFSQLAISPGDEGRSLGTAETATPPQGTGADHAIEASQDLANAPCVKTLKLSLPEAEDSGSGVVVVTGNVRAIMMGEARESQAWPYANGTRPVNMMSLIDSGKAAAHETTSLGGQVRNGSDLLARADLGLQVVHKERHRRPVRLLGQYVFVCLRRIRSCADRGCAHDRSCAATPLHPARPRCDAPPREGQN